MIILVRHAQPLGGAGRFVGSTDLPLSPRGVTQADGLAQGLKEAGIQTLYASPLARARETAAPLAAALALPVQIMEGLAEIDLGEWDGHLRADIKAREPEAYAERGRNFSTFTPPGGESFADVQARGLAALALLAQAPQPVVAVTHAGVIRAVLCHVLGLPLDNLFRIAPALARCTVLAPCAAGFTLQGLNLSTV